MNKNNTENVNITGVEEETTQRGKADVKGSVSTSMNVYRILLIDEEAEIEPDPAEEEGGSEDW